MRDLGVSSIPFDFTVSWSDSGGDFLTPLVYNLSVPDTQGYFYKKLSRAGTYRERQHRIYFRSPSNKFTLIGAEEDVEVLKQ